MALTYKEIKSEKQRRTRDTWIHPDGDIAFIFDTSSSVNPQEELSKITTLLNSVLLSEQKVIPDSIWGQIISNEQKFSSGLSISMFYRDREVINVKSIGELSLARFNNQQMELLSNAAQIPLKYGEFYLAFTGGTDSQSLCHASEQIRSARSTVQFEQVANGCKTSDDWALLVFPIEFSSCYIDPAWPENPFVGIQEGLEHEKRGLAEIARALFREKDFTGFKIIGGHHCMTKYGTRLLDGVLVSPWGVLLLELKDHYGTVTLHANNWNAGMIVSSSSGRVRSSEPNPIMKIDDTLKKSLKLELGIPVDNRLRKAAVIFTWPGVTVSCVDSAGQSHNEPYNAGNVLVSTPENLAQLIRDYMVGSMGSRPKEGGFLSQEMICKIADHLAGENYNIPRQQGEILKVDNYLISSEPDLRESTSYYTVHTTIREGSSRRLWAKRYDLTSMVRGGDVGQEALRVGREADALHGLMRVPGVQLCRKNIVRDRYCYVIVEQVAGIPLDEWLLSNNPSRPEKTGALVELADILAALAEENIVHRAIKPFNIRIDDDGCPTLINFELSHVYDLATINPSARKQMDVDFLPQEALTPGRKITPAVDTYSFGKIACFVLGGKMPFKDFYEQLRLGNNPVFWKKIATDCLLTDQQLADIRKMLSPDPNQRPIGSEVAAIVRGWC